MVPATPRPTRIIHQVWIQGAAQLPEQYQVNRQLWAARMPGWEMVLWDNEMARAQWADNADVERWSDLFAGN